LARVLSLASFARSVSIGFRSSSTCPWRYGIVAHARTSTRHDDSFVAFRAYRSPCTGEAASGPRSSWLRGEIMTPRSSPARSWDPNMTDGRACSTCRSSCALAGGRLNPAALLNRGLCVRNAPATRASVWRLATAAVRAALVWPTRCGVADMLGSPSWKCLKNISARNRRWVLGPACWLAVFTSSSTQASGGRWRGRAGVRLHLG